MSDSPFSYEELLRFYEETGVDCALSETPHNRFEESHESAHRRAAAFIVEKHNQHESMQADIGTSTVSKAPSQPASPRKVEIPNEGQIALAQQLAASATTLDELRQKIEAFDGCALKFTAKHTCFADGVAGSRLMLISDIPGRDEDLEGVPFAGLGGQLLNNMLSAINLDRENVYLANTIFWRPPGNRQPTLKEIELCRPFIERQIELASPEIILTMGEFATQLLTGEKQNIMRLRGQWKSYQPPSGQTIALMPTLHPSYLLKMPEHKKFAWSDLLQIKARLQNKS